ncbi:hypothetical protein VOLCADRAFT_90800 [Volvox carteri f. nagariensis]|uniref:Interferon-related developmental regulator N-terminal domain-containing protein n=1 Tax=Volvox carteri f. nagariensis TaxID=3068 RepID=D8TV31_VOLCA|nr:uncharacterized protein VOLCADRAFT_90800 [Volvox carteri f. nagariensis]EFJ48631.1 hypothetical protein VOLCADRAFT_90800 [Volvox carteri f. nagariensis]|eukprot:XP_002950430.1 hypothetical protein VOLCADRAFT_90800 [Volvox carteri f. nagariensis]
MASLRSLRRLQGTWAERRRPAEQVWGRQRHWAVGGRAHGVSAAAASCLELASLGRDGPGSVSTASVCSAFSYLDGDAEDIQVDEFERRLDALFEKSNETLTSRCLVAVKRGSAVESSLACQLLGLHILTLGQPDERLFQTLRPELERSASGDAGGGAAVQVAAMDTLALAAFVLAEDEIGTRVTMDRLRGMWRKGDVKARAAAVRGWSFLLTSLNGEMRDDEATSCLAALAGLMNERDLELRTAAGEAVAVLRCCCSIRVLGLLAGAEEAEGLVGEGDGEVEAADVYDSQEREDGWEDERDDEHEKSERVEVDRAGSNAGRHGRTRNEDRDGGGGSGQLAEVLERMQNLASNKCEALRRNRRDRAALRSTFRGLVAVLNDGRVPECRIKLQYGDSLTVEGVAATQRLAFLRRFLAGGFQAHLQHNPLMHDVFDFRPRTERPERLSAAEKRLTRSCHSADARARTADRQWARDSKASRLHFGGC